MSKTWDFDDYPWVDEYDQRQRGRARLCYEETLRRLPDCVGVTGEELVLDIGTGTGNSAVPFLERGCRVVGVDPSERMLKQARAKAEQWEGLFSVQRVAEPFLCLPFDAGTFDVVVSAYAIHHLDDEAKRQAIAEMKRALRPGGRIIIADTIFRDEEHKAQALRDYADMEDEYQPLVTTFPGMFEAEGFGVEMERVGELVWIVVARQQARSED